MQRLLIGLAIGAISFHALIAFCDECGKLLAHYRGE